MFDGNIPKSLDRNRSLSLFYSRRTPSKNKPEKKQSRFLLPSGEYLSPVKVNTTTPYNSTTTPILVHSLSDMSLKNESVDRSDDDSPTPASRYSKIKTSIGKRDINKSFINSIENPIPLYPNTIPQRINIKSNSTSKIESNQNMLTLPKFQRKSARMAVVTNERKPVNLFTNRSQGENDELDDTPLGNKINNSFAMEKNQMNLDVQSNDLDNCPHSNGFLNEDGIWEDPTLSQSESRCLQTPTVGNIMINNNEDSNSQKEQYTNTNDKLLWEMEDENKFNDKENIIPDDYKGVLAEREWCDLGNDEDSMMEEYDNNDYIGSSSQNKSTPRSNLQKGKKQVNGMIKKSEYQHVRYAFQEISINSMPEYQMNSVDCNSIYSNSSFGSNCDSQTMMTPKKYSSSNCKMNGSFSNSFINDNNDNNDTTPSFFNIMPLIKNMKNNNNASSSSSSKKSAYTKRLVYQLCGVPDMNAAHKKSMTRARIAEKKGMMEGAMPNNSSFMNSSPIISKSSILSPPFLLSSPVIRNGFSSPLVQNANTNYSFVLPKNKKPFNPMDEARQSNDSFVKKDTKYPVTSEDKSHRAHKVSLLTTSINNSLSSSEGERSTILEPTPTTDTLDGEVTPKPGRPNPLNNNKLSSEETVFFPHYHSRQHSRVDSNKEKEEEDKKEIDDSLLNQTSSMMSISPTTLSKINETHQSFMQLNQKLDMVVQEISSGNTVSSTMPMNMPKRNRLMVEEKKKELVNRRRSRLKKFY